MYAPGATPAPSTPPRPTRPSWRSCTRGSPPDRPHATSHRRRASERAGLPDGTSALAAVVDTPQHPRGRAGGHRERLDVAGDHAVRADHAPFPDLHAAGDDHVRAQPAVLADPRRALGLKALPRHRLLGIVVAVGRGADGTAVG